MSEKYFHIVNYRDDVVFFFFREEKDPENPDFPPQKIPYNKQLMEIVNSVFTDQLRDAYISPLYQGISAKGLLPSLDTLEEALLAQEEEIEGIKIFVSELRQAAVNIKQQLEKRLADNVCSFDDIPLLFDKGTYLTFKLDEKDVCGSLQSVRLTRSMMAGPKYEMVIEIALAAVTNKTITARYIIEVADFNGLRPIELLPVHETTTDELALFTERGQKVLDLNKEPSYMNYTSQLTQRTWWNEVHQNAVGRIMIDATAMTNVESDLHERLINKFHKAARQSRSITPEVPGKKPHDIRHLIMPFVFGFSFRCKQWGLMDIEHISDIMWRDDALDKLVMDQQDKQIISNLVEHNEGSFSDIIENKGGGCIFLLHGPPGQGKTLTAEALAEHLHRPLYSVSVGELGVDPQSLENTLRNILDLVTQWNAVLLMDEADIFLEQRDEKDILRNAMVGVFLRLLEYHQGVLFLTTNRVKNIDHAFYSRVSLAIHFDEADHDKRAQIWANLLTAAGIESLQSEDISSLAQAPINGRQIKNIIRQCQILAKASNITVDRNLLLSITERVQAFEKRQNQAT